MGRTYVAMPPPTIMPEGREMRMQMDTAPQTRTGKFLTRLRLKHPLRYYRIIMPFRLMGIVTLPIVVLISVLMALLWTPGWIAWLAFTLVTRRSLAAKDTDVLSANPVFVGILIVGGYRVSRGLAWDILRLKALGRPVTNEELFSLTGDYTAYAGDYD